jgi:hypothetical protein
MMSRAAWFVLDIIGITIVALFTIVAAIVIAAWWLLNPVPHE